MIYFFFLPETGGKSLEEIGEIFGDVAASEHIGLKKERDLEVVQAEFRAEADTVPRETTAREMSGAKKVIT